MRQEDSFNEKQFYTYAYFGGRRYYPSTNANYNFDTLNHRTVSWLYYQMHASIHKQQKTNFRYRVSHRAAYLHLRRSKTDIKNQTQRLKNYHCMMRTSANDGTMGMHKCSNLVILLKTAIALGQMTYLNYICKHANNPNATILSWSCSTGLQATVTRSQANLFS